MEQIINDPNRSDRRAFVIVGIVLSALAIVQTLVDDSMLPVTCVELVACVLMSIFGMMGRPYVVLDSNGVTYRLPFRKKFCPWNEIGQVGIRNTKATRVPVEYLFSIVIVLPGASKHKWMRDLLQTLVIPNRPEIRRFLDACHGPLDFDDTGALNDWQKKYYGFHKDR